MNSAVWSIAPVLAAQVFVAAVFFLPAPGGGSPVVPAIAVAVTTPHPALPEIATPRPAPPEITTPHPALPEIATARPALPEIATPRPAQPEIATARPAPPEIATPRLALPVPDRAWAPVTPAPGLAGPTRTASASTPPDGTTVHPPGATARRGPTGTTGTLVASRRQTPADPPVLFHAPAPVTPGIVSPAPASGSWTAPGGTTVHPPRVAARRGQADSTGTPLAGRRTGLSDRTPDTPRALPPEPPAPTGSGVAGPPAIAVAGAPRGPAAEVRLATGWLERARRHTEMVMPGDSLWRIASRRYGEGLAWPGLWRANRARIADPDLIYPGQVLLLP